MPIFGIGLHVIVALFFAIHALRNGRNMYWLFVLFSFPLLGSIVYFFVEYLPGSRVNRQLGKAASVAVDMLDPAREVREARQAFDLSPSVQNQFRLAKALAAKGEHQEALTHFDTCLCGPFGRDVEIRYHAAHNRLELGRGQEALDLIEFLRGDANAFNSERIMLLHARALAALNRTEEAGAEFAAARDRIGSFECKARYALWAAQSGRQAEAAKELEGLRKDARHWTAHARSLNNGLLKEVERAVEKA